MPSITITDLTSGATATILPELGFNCFSFRVPIAGREIEALWAEPGFDPSHRPSRSGIPILFPFAGRIRDGRFRWEGEDYAVPGAQTNHGNTIHGFVMTRPWRIITQTANRVTASFQASLDDPALLTQWPADFRITVTYEVSGATLGSEIVVENPDQRPLPFGFGTHPYFRLPIGGANAGECLARVPATGMMEQAEQLPTGRITGVDRARDLRAGARFGDLMLDDILVDLTPSVNGRIETSVTEPDSGLAIEQRFDPAFIACVVFTPSHREAIAIEPYTTMPDAFALLEQGVNPNLLILSPGGVWSARIEISVRNR